MSQVERSRRYRAKHPERVRASERARKQRNAGKPCIKCDKNPRPANHEYCHECRRANIRNWRASHPEQHTRNWRSSMLRRKFGITLGEYESLLVLQSGVCTICGHPPKTRRLAVDHNHKTGYVRGLLCHVCNRGLSYFRDRAEVLARAAEYLRLSL